MGTEFEQPESLSDFAQSNLLPTPEKGVFRTLSSPVILQWEITPYCNERCVHCYNYWRAADKCEKLIVTPEMLRVYDRASSEIVNNKVFQVTITGGEPLAVLKWSYPYLQRLAENNVDMSFNTNLTMLTKEKTDLLKNLGVRSVLTSLISGDPQLNDQLANRPNTQKDVTKGIKLAVGEGFWVGVNMVVTKKNLNYIYSTAEYVKSLGVMAFSATKASTPTNSYSFEEYALSPQELKIMIQELIRVRDNLDLNTDSLEFYPMCLFDTQQARDFTANHSCNAGKTGCTIGFDGSVRPCSHASQIYGSVQDKGGLKMAWGNLRPWRTEEYIPAQCSECKLRAQCRGGCRSEAYVINGNLNAPDPYCDYNNMVILKTTNKRVSVNPSIKYRFNLAVKMRDEDFGGILFASPAKWTPVTQELYNFFKIKSRGEFYLNELSNNLKLESLEEVIPTVEFLIQKNILQEGGDKK